jgi:hypothetical protein
MQHMMVVVPVNGEIYEAQDVAQEYGQQGREAFETLAMRDLQFKNHYRNDDGQDAITKRF